MILRRRRTNWRLFSNWIFSTFWRNWKRILILSNDCVISYSSTFKKQTHCSEKKTFFFRQSSFIKYIVRKIYFRRIIVENSTTKKLKLESYRQLQKTFNQIYFLIYFCNDKILYIDIDAFKRREFEVMIYYFKSKIIRTIRNVTT